MDVSEQLQLVPRKAQMLRGWNLHESADLMESLAVEVEKLRRPQCVWTHDEDYEQYTTSCGSSWSFIDDGIAENGVKFCPHCGGEVKEDAKAAGEDADDA